MTKTRWGIAIAAVAAVMALGGGLSFGALRQESNTATVSTHATRSVTAHCGGAKEAVSGGFATPGFDGFDTTGGPEIFTFVSKRLGGDWRVTGTDESPDHPGPLTSFAYCARHAPSVKTRSSTVGIGPSDATGSATAKCPRGSEAISGGYAGSEFNPTSSAGADIIVFTSKRVHQRKWKARAINDGDQPGTLKAFAYCERHGPGLKTRSSSRSVPRGATKSTSAKCPRGTEAFSGGFQSVFKGTMPTRLALTIVSRRTKARVWKATGFGFGDLDSPLRVFAYCKP